MVWSRKMILGASSPVHGGQSCPSPLFMHSFCMRHQVIQRAPLAAIVISRGFGHKKILTLTACLPSCRPRGHLPNVGSLVFQAYYDPVKKRWIFPGEENKEDDNPALGPPPTGPMVRTRSFCHILSQF
jgi:hypothetical protein